MKTPRNRSSRSVRRLTRALALSAVQGAAKTAGAAAASALMWWLQHR